MSDKRFTYSETIDYNFFDVFEEKKYLGMVQRDSTKIVDRLNEQQAIIDKQELRLQHIEELLELSENLNKSYREKLIDMNLKMVIDDE